MKKEPSKVFAVWKMIGVPIVGSALLLFVWTVGLFAVLLDKKLGWIPMVVVFVIVAAYIFSFQGERMNEDYPGWLD